MQSIKAHRKRSVAKHLRPVGCLELHVRAYGGLDPCALKGIETLREVPPGQVRIDFAGALDAGADTSRPAGHVV